MDNTHIEQVQQSNYLGNKITVGGHSKANIIYRIAQVKRTFQNKENLLTTKCDFIARRKLLKIYIWSNNLYSCKTWTISTVERSKLGAFEMWCYRRMLKIKLTERITNETVLTRIKGKL